MKLNIKRLIRRFTHNSVGITFPQMYLLAIPWLKVGDKIDMIAKTDEESGKTIIILQESVTSDGLKDDSEE